MSTEHRNIGEIVSLCKQGDRKSQKTLFEVFSSQMLSLCFRYASSQEDAEDMLIEGFMRAFENIDSYKDNGCDFVFWLRKVMINNCINFLNKQNKESMFTSIDYASEIDETQYEIPDTVAENFTQEELFCCVQNLSPLMRSVFNLYAIDQFSYKEIATRLEISEAMVKLYVFRARKQLKKHLMEISERKKQAKQ